MYFHEYVLHIPLTAAYIGVCSVHLHHLRSISRIQFIWVLGAGPLLGGYVAGRCAARGLVAHAAGAGIVGAAAYLTLYWQEISPAWLAWSLLPWACGLAGGGGRLALARRARIDRA